MWPSTMPYFSGTTLTMVLLPVTVTVTVTQQWPQRDYVTFLTIDLPDMGDTA